MSNIDWSAPIEFVSGEYTYPAEDRGPYGDRGRVVVVDFRDHHAVVGTSTRGRPYHGIPGYDGYIRNIPEPKREPRTVWIPEEVDRYGTLYLAISEALMLHPTKVYANTKMSKWHKFVEVVE